MAAYVLDISYHIVEYCIYRTYCMIPIRCLSLNMEVRSMLPRILVYRESALAYSEKLALVMFPRGKIIELVYHVTHV
jgi:hypothetical protein